MARIWTDNRLAVIFTLPTSDCGITPGMLAVDLFGQDAEQLPTRCSMGKIESILRWLAGKEYVPDFEACWLTQKGRKKQLKLGRKYDNTPGDWERWDMLWQSVRDGHGGEKG